MFIKKLFLLLLIINFLAFFPRNLQSDIKFYEKNFEKDREEMIKVIKLITKDTRVKSKAFINPEILDVMKSIPRHKFVSENLQRYAYADRPLPIGYGQTISQPYIVALMTDLLGVDDEDVVLEIGTGSGYQAAVLSEIVKHVYTIEIIKSLALQAKKRLRKLGYENITTNIGDGYLGWEIHAPFDVIIVTAAASHIPPPLIAQLKKGGKMIIPVIGSILIQHLVIVEKDMDGKIKTEILLPVRFVPLTGEH